MGPRTRVNVDGTGNDRDRIMMDERANELADKRRERAEKRKQALDDQLDQGLEDSFPGSDPVAVTQPPPSARDKDKP
jgi:hypothetical protein